jgi:hypothetical protein
MPLTDVTPVDADFDYNGFRHAIPRFQQLTGNEQPATTVKDHYQRLDDASPLITRSSLNLFRLRKWMIHLVPASRWLPGFHETPSHEFEAVSHRSPLLS